MAKRTIQAVFVLTILSSALAAYHDPCTAAFNECDWEFYDKPGQIPSFSVNSKPDRPFTPLIVSKDMSEVIGVLNTNYLVPEFITRSGPFPITYFGYPRFTPTHFKPLTIDYVMGSGVAHQTFQGNQRWVAKGRCVRVFFTTFQLLMHGYPPQTKNINVGREDYKCVVFRLK